MWKAAREAEVETALRAITTEAEQGVTSPPRTSPEPSRTLEPMAFDTAPFTAIADELKAIARALADVGSRLPEPAQEAVYAEARKVRDLGVRLNHVTQEQATPAGCFHPFNLQDVVAIKGGRGERRTCRRCGKSW